MSSKSDQEESSAIGRNKLNIALPPLNPATIQRAKEGLAAARDRFSQEIKYQALENREKTAEPGKKNGISGEMRRFMLRSFIHTLFRVNVEYAERIPKVLQAALMDLLPKNYQEPQELKFGRYFLNHLFW